MTTDIRTNEPSHNRITIQAFRDGEVSIIHEDRVRAIACTLDELKRAVATYEARGALEAADRPAGTFTEAQVEAAAKALTEAADELALLNDGGKRGLAGHSKSSASAITHRHAIAVIRARAEAYRQEREEQ